MQEWGILRHAFCVPKSPLHCLENHRLRVDANESVIGFSLSRVFTKILT